jgi:glycosyltransferase involved in cell wall biosynthesis
MQVLIYTHAFPPMVGGIETITMELAQRLAGSVRPDSQEELQVTVVAPKSEAAMNECDLPFNIVRNPSFVQLARLIRAADILHVAGTDMLPLFLGWLLHKRMVVEHHGFQTACPNGQMIYELTQSPCPGHYMAGNHMECLKCNSARGTIYSLNRWLLTFPRRWFCLHARANVMPTAWLGSILQLSRMVTIHHGLPATKDTVTSANEDPPSIVFLGRLVTTKGVHILLQAAHQLLDCQFQLNIIGDGPERVRLEADVRSLGLDGRVCFRGYLPATEVELALAASRVVVMPSLGGEVFGLVALENMLRGKVLIVSEIGALTEVVGDAGLAFPIGDTPALARCLRKVLQSTKFSEEIGAQAVRRALSLFTPERMANEHLDLYQRLLGDCSGKAAALDSLVSSAPSVQ